MNRSLVLFIVLGIVVGWLGARLAGRHEGIIASLIIGIIGSFIGSFIAFYLAHGNASYLNLTLSGFLWSLLGAVILSAILNLFSHHNSRA